MTGAIRERKIDEPAAFAAAEALWKRWLLGFILAGFLLRAAAWSRFLCDADSYFYMLMAGNLHDHGVFGGPLGEGGSMFFPAKCLLYKWLYPVLMAPLLSFFGAGTAGHLVSLASGVLFIPAMFFAARALTRDTLAALAAAGLACFSYSNTSWSGNVLPDSLCTLLLTLAIWMGVAEGAALRQAFAAGVFFSSAAITRPEMAVLAPAGLLATLAASRRRISLRAAAFLAGAALAAAPVVLLARYDPNAVRPASSPAHSIAEEVSRFERVLGDRVDAVHVFRFALEEIPLAVALLFLPCALASAPAGFSRRFAAYAAWHVASLGAVYNLFINESVRYYTHFLPVLLPLGASGLAALARARPARTATRIARLACFSGVLMGVAAQAAKTLYEGHRSPGYEKEAARIAVGLAERLERSNNMRGGILLVSHNRHAMHALTGLPAAGYSRAGWNSGFFAPGARSGKLTRFLVVIDSHLRNTDPVAAALGGRFADRRLAEARIPAAMNRLYAKQGLRFTDDRFEFYLFSPQQAGGVAAAAPASRRGDGAFTASPQSSRRTTERADGKEIATTGCAKFTK